jgi:antibiotic biosynthesis monooxygenase
MVIELVRFTVHEGAEAALLAERPAMITALRERFPLLRATYLTREDDDSWLDLFVWENRDAATEASAVVTTIPECVSWFRHIAEPGGIRHVEVLDAWHRS